MITKFFNGVKFHNDLNINIKKNIEKYIKLYNDIPCLAIILIGNNFNSNFYAKNKLILCKKLSINFFLFKASKTLKLETLIILVNILNNDVFINGIFIQKPLPFFLNKKILFKSINFVKDVDLMNPINFKNYIFKNKFFILPSIIRSVFFLIDKLNINLYDKKILIFGFSNTVGKPLYYKFLLNGYCVNVIDNNLKSNYVIKSYDLIIIGIGSSFFLSKNMVSYGCIIIDIGINNYIDSTIVGDTNINDLIGKSSFITPVPGGIGPLTISFLLLNTLDLYVQQKKINNI